MKCVVASVFLILLIGLVPLLGQDTTRVKKIQQLKDKKVTQRMMGFISRTPPVDTVTNKKSEDAFMPYEGKIIRKIVVNQIGFERSIQDTTRSIRNFVTKAANRLHNDSKAWVIRENIFLRENKPLNPYRVADNERYLRDLDFILDSHIYVIPVSPESDSVDLLVMTRDVFSLGASFSPRSPTEYRFKVQEANLAGMGQRLQISGIIDPDRSPASGYEILYQKKNLFGSFINASVGFTQINSGRSIGNEEENAYFFRLDRPLFHPFVRWAGGGEFSRNWSENLFRKADSLYARYDYEIRDLWAGYSFGHRKLPSAITENRNRKFIAIRAFEEHFLESPTVPLSFEERILYSDRVTVLAQLTFFKQDFYKTRYVLGFGRTEDVPYGYRVSLTSGWEKELGNKRPYTGGELNWSTVNKNGTFYTYNIRLGNYWGDETIEDALAQVNVSRYSRLYLIGKMKLRNQLEGGYTVQVNRTVKPSLDIRDVNGINGFRPDSLRGAMRLNFRTETVLFTQWKLLGFGLAPVARLDFAYLSKENDRLIRARNFYSGMSAALRARNENLIFNTIEARVYYYPRTVEALDNFRFEFRANLRIKYPTNLVTAPATVYDP